MKRFAPATARNRQPIAKVLRQYLPSAGLVLEVASGTGEHAVFFANCFPTLQWQPSDIDDDALKSISAWSDEANLPNLHQPIVLDAAGSWPDLDAQAVLSINMVHISPWEATKGLIRGAADTLDRQGTLFLYGPYNVDGAFTSASNEAFDRSLRQRDPSWGLRDLAAVAALCEDNGFEAIASVPMPANNYSLVFRRV